MWRDHPFSQRNRTTERTVVVGAGVDKKVGVGGARDLKKGVDNIGGSSKIGGVAPLCQLCKETLKILRALIIKPTLPHSWLPPYF